MNDNHSAFRSEEYDSEIRRTLPYYEEYYKQIMDLAKICNFRRLTWLDIGCGTGKMAEEVFGQMDLNKFVFCDCSEKMIEIVKKRFQVSNAEFLLSDIRNIEYNDVFDVITAVQVNHYLHKAEREAVIKKCYDALHTGGLFFSFENFAPFSANGKRLYLERWRAYQLEQGKSIRDCESHISRYNKEYYPISVAGHLYILHKSGFHTAEILWISFMQVGLLGVK